MILKTNIAVSESGFIFDPDSGESFSVNATGKEIIKILATGKSLTETQKIIQEKYAVDDTTFQRYMDDFTHTLRRFNLIEHFEDE